ncbi:MAG: hypothetical protein HJJLKODD_02643 [Phycisphaerae bacterium]|nr:hypothetical protein [Phycisphaerae bacterium]
MINQNVARHLVDRWVAEAELLGKSDQLAIKRGQVRFISPGDYRLQSLDGSESREHCVRGYNISISGLGVMSKERLPAGTRVLIHTDIDNGNMPGVLASVIHCTQTVGGYKLGLQFDFHPAEV